MANLPPSRRDIIGPPSRDPRDKTDLSAQNRHHGSWLRSLDPGMVGGRPATPRPVRGGTPGLVGGDGGGDATSYEWQWDDRGIVQSVGAQAFHLTYEPVEESLFVRWHPDGREGLPLTNEHFTVSGQSVLIADSGVFKVGDQFSFQYQFDPGVESEVVSFIPRGWFRDVVTNPIHLPSDTQIGDTIVFIVFEQRGWVPSVTDSRLTLVGAGPVTVGPGGDAGVRVYMGPATSLDDIGVTGGNLWIMCDVITFAGYIGHGATADVSAAAATTNIPVLDVSAALLVTTLNAGFVAGAAPSTTAAGWVLAGGDTLIPPGFSMAKVYTYSGDAPTPSGTIDSGGGDGRDWHIVIQATP